MISGTAGKLIKILFAVALLLLVSDLLLEKLYPGAGKNIPAVTPSEADSVFLNISSSFGIEDKWIVKKGSIYKARIPVDLPAELIILDLSEAFRNKDFTVISKEVVKGSKSLMELASGDKNVLTVEFTYDNSKKRNISTLAFILLNINNLSDEELSHLLSLSDNYTVALDPSRKNRDLIPLLAAKGKEYSLLIDNRISELEYRLDDKFSDKKLITTIQTITAHFSEAVYIILDDIPSLYSERVDKLVHKELDKRRMKYKYLNDFVRINEISSPGQFRSFLSMSGDRVFTIDASQFLKYKDELRAVRKKGIKVSNLSALVI